VHACRGGGAGGERISSRPLLSMETDMGLALRTPRS